VSKGKMLQHPECRSNGIQPNEKRRGHLHVIEHFGSPKRSRMRITVLSAFKATPSPVEGSVRRGTLLNSMPNSISLRPRMARRGTIQFGIAGPMAAICGAAVLGGCGYSASQEYSRIRAIVVPAQQGDGSVVASLTPWNSPPSVARAIASADRARGHAVDTRVTGD